jgi:predicted RNA-binding Zn-ribbon protein involved in translation (DUF1610 family)
MPNDEPVSETQRRNLAEYAGTHAPRNHDEAYRLICSLEMRILNAINETFDQRAYVDHSVYRILNEKLKRADFLMELKENGHLSQELREKVVALAEKVIAPDIFLKLRIRGRVKNKSNKTTDIHFTCLNCRQHLVIDAVGQNLEVVCPNCGKLVTTNQKKRHLFDLSKFRKFFGLRE